MSKSTNADKDKLIHIKDHPLAKKRNGLVKRGPEQSNNHQERIVVLPGAMRSDRILVVDDDRSVREIICEFLNNAGYECYPAGSAEQALEILNENQVDLVITDVIMPGMSGLELTDIIKSEFDSAVIIMTGHRPNCSYGEAMNLGASDLFYKPARLADILRMVRNNLDQTLTRAEGQSLNSELKLKFYEHYSIFKL